MFAGFGGFPSPALFCSLLTWLADKMWLIDRPTGRHTDRRTDRQTDGRTDGDRDRDSDRDRAAPQDLIPAVLQTQNVTYTYQPLAVINLAPKVGCYPCGGNLFFKVVLAARCFWHSMFTCTPKS